MNKAFAGRLFKDGHNVMHQILAWRTDAFGSIETEIETVCGLRRFVLPKVSLHKHGMVSCMNCLVKTR